MFPISIFDIQSIVQILFSQRSNISFQDDFSMELFAGGFNQSVTNVGYDLWKSCRERWISIRSDYCFCHRKYLFPYSTKSIYERKIQWTSFSWKCIGGDQCLPRGCAQISSRTKEKEENDSPFSWCSLRWISIRLWSFHWLSKENGERKKKRNNHLVFIALLIIIFTNGSKGIPPTLIIITKKNKRDQFQ